MKIDINKLVKDIKSFINNEKKKTKGVVKITQPVSHFLNYSSDTEMFECHQAMERAVILLEDEKDVFKIQTHKGYYHGRNLFVSMIVFCNPCKEFEQLLKYLKKYAAYDLEIGTFFHQKLVGKRNDMESYDEQYFAYNPKVCSEILSWLKNNKATSYTIQIGEKRIIEKYDYNGYEGESEWYGWEENAMQIELLTKKRGKLKTQQVFYL